MRLSFNCIKRSAFVLYWGCINIILVGPNNTPISNSLLPPSAILLHFILGESTLPCLTQSQSIHENYVGNQISNLDLCLFFL